MTLKKTKAKAAKKEKIEQPKWISDVLQGLCYWVGYRYSYYRHYPLGESALVGELCNLLNAKIDNNQELLCEVLRKNLGVKDGGTTRCDLVIASKNANDRNKKLKQRVIYAIEVKRASASNSELEDDLRRLCNFLEAQKKLKKIDDIPKAYLIVIGKRKAKQKKFLENFVSDKGVAKRGKKHTKKHGIEYCVRKVCKATGSFRDEAYKSAYYAVMIEVMV